MAGPQLRVVDGPSAGRELLVEQELTIGRTETGPGSLGNDPEISRQHARLRRLESGEILVEDLGSTNGTFVNGARIDAPRVLGPGDTIKLGQTTLQLEGGAQATILSAPAVAPQTRMAAQAAAPPPAAPPPAAPPPAAPAVERRGIRWPLIGGVALVAAGVAAAVIGLISEGNGGGSSTQAAAAAATTTGSAGTKSTSEKAAPGKLTPVGSTLKLGSTAVIAYEDASTHVKSVVAITPSPIEKGSISDFKNVQLTAEQKTATPYYVKVKAKNVGRGDLSGGSPATYIDGIDDRGQRQRSVIFFGDFPRCPSKTPKKLPPDASYSTCLTYLVPGGGSIVGMRWVVFDRKTGKSDLNWR
ncbi:MAG TPA: FHA domain-containing protein [Thermoleophilaceae bacterium]|nr:FHA domain-containing protein [Thermoleophilaceae bacterium]